MTMKPDFIDKIDQKNEIALVLSFILLVLKCFAKKKCPQVVYAYSPYTAPLFFIISCGPQIRLIVSSKFAGLFSMVFYFVFLFYFCFKILNACE